MQEALTWTIYAIGLGCLFGLVCRDERERRAHTPPGTCLSCNAAPVEQGCEECIQCLAGRP